MVEWTLVLGKFESRFSSGKILLASPCLAAYQKELISELQQRAPRVKISDQTGNVRITDAPILMVKHLLHLDGKENKKFFQWWCSEFNFNPESSETLSNIMPKNDEQWRSLKVEKKIALFLGASIMARDFTYAFLEDLHLEENEQTFLFNFLKNLTQVSSHQVIVFWSYRLQLANSVPVYFKGFKEHAA